MVLDINGQSITIDEQRDELECLVWGTVENKITIRGKEIRIISALSESRWNVFFLIRNEDNDKPQKTLYAYQQIYNGNINVDSMMDDFSHSLQLNIYKELRNGFCFNCGKYQKLL